MKIKTGIAAILAAASLFCLTGCNGNVDNETTGFISEVELEGYEYDVLAQLPDSLALDVEGGRYMRCSGQGMLPVKIGGREVEALRDSLVKLAGIELTDRESAIPRLEEGFTLSDADPAKEAGCSTQFNRLSVAMVTPQLVVWKNYSYSYPCRAAHGIYNTTFVNYSIEKGKILTPADLFKAGYESSLLGIIREKLVENKVDLSVELDEVTIPKDFEITENGMNFIYSLYEIAPYVEGEVTVEIYSYELSDLFAPGVEKMLYGVTAE